MLASESGLFQDSRPLLLGLHLCLTTSTKAPRGYECTSVCRYPTRAACCKSEIRYNSN